MGHDRPEGALLTGSTETLQTYASEFRVVRCERASYYEVEEESPRSSPVPGSPASGIVLGVRERDADNRRRRDAIERALRAEFEPLHLEVHDESGRHRGHAGAASGGGHFGVTIVSRRFAEVARLERHRMLYRALEELLGAEIHALAIRALTPEEWERAR